MAVRMQIEEPSESHFALHPPDLPPEAAFDVSPCLASAYSFGVIPSSELRAVCRAPLALVIAAKEAVYKCQYPLTRQSLSWRDIRVAFGDGVFRTP